MASPRRRRILLGLAVVLSALIAMAIWAIPEPPTPPAVPDPNGYDRLVRAGGLIDPAAAPNGGDIGAADPNMLRGWVDDHRRALDLADRGLALPSGVPLQFDYREPSFDDLGPIRMLGRLMHAEVRALQAEGRSAEAADRAMSLVRFGPHVSRNGLLLHRMVGVALERNGLDALAALIDDLGPEARAALARTLRDIGAAAIPASETIALEADWARVAPPRNVRFAYTFAPGVRKTLNALKAPAEAQCAKALRDLSIRRNELADLLDADLTGTRPGEEDD